MNVEPQHNMSNDNAHYKALRKKMVSIVIIVSFTPMILVSGIILNRFKISYHEKVYAHLEELVQKHKQNIDTFLNERMADILFITASCSLEELVDKQTLSNKLTFLQQEGGQFFVDLGVIDENGNQIAYAGPFKLGKAQYSEAEWFKAAMNNKYYISDVFLGLRGLPHFIVTARKKTNNKYWMLRATIDFMSFNNLVANIHLGETGFAFILNRKAEFQTKLLHDIKADGDLYNGFVKKKPPPHAVTIVEKTDFSGQKKIYASAFLKHGDWLLVYQQNSRDAFSDLNRSQLVAFIIIFLGGIAIVSMAFYLSRRMVNRIVLANKEKEVMNRQVIESGKLATVGELAAGIAHEINNPVAIMVEEAGWIQDLLEDEETDTFKNMQEFERALAQINTQGKRCKEITHKLLSFARKTDSRIQDVQVNDLIEEVVSLSAQRAKYSSVEIRTVFQEHLPCIRASQSEMQQICLNLLNNALDAMEQTGGTIIITTTVETQMVVIAFKDNGPGIPRTNLSRIFDPFFTTKPVGKGTGLGLSICYGIIHKMGGKIEAQSEVGRGTSFFIRLPVSVPDDDHAE